MKLGTHLSEIGRILGTVTVDWNWLKAVAAVAGGLWAWLAPSASTLLTAQALLCLVLLDFATGVRAAVKRGQFIQSRLWNKIVDKSVAYGGLIFLAIIARKFLPETPLVSALVEGILVVVCLGELISVLENLHKLGVPVVGRVAKALRIKVDRLGDEIEEQVSGGARG